MPDNEVTVLAPLNFHGHTKSNNAADHKQMAPEDFIREIYARKTQHEWNDERTISHAASQFRDEAAAWWDESLDLDYDDAQVDNIHRIWTHFKKAFKLQWYKTKTRSIDWHGISKQAENEEVISYIIRVNTQIHKYFGISRGEANIEDPEIVESLPATTTMINALPLVNREEVRAAIAAESVRNAIITRNKAMKQIARDVIRKLIVTGLSNPKLRTYASNLEEQEDLDYHTLISKIKIAFDRPDLISKIRPGNNGNGRRAVNEVAVEDEGACEAEDVTAVNGRANGANNKGRKGRSGRNQSKTNKCAFCHNFGHSDKTCWAKHGKPEDRVKTVNALAASGAITASGNEDGAWMF